MLYGPPLAWQLLMFFLQSWGNDMRLKSILFGLCVLVFSVLAQAQTAAYIRGASKPWGESTNESAMDAAFGAGNWSDLTLAGGVAPFLPAAGYKFIFLEGGDETAIELNDYLTANRTQIEAFVTTGGRLFLNSAPNEGGNINYGFGGVVLTYDNTESEAVVAANNAHPVFAGPATPVATSYTGNSFGHAIVGAGVVPIIIGAPGDNVAGKTVLGEKQFGAGCVLLGGMTTDNFHAPQPDAHNLRINILSYVSNQSTVCGVPVVATSVPVPLGGPWIHLLMSAAFAGMGFAGMRRRSGI